MRCEIIEKFKERETGRIVMSVFLGKILVSNNELQHPARCDSKETINIYLIAVET